MSKNQKRNVHTIGKENFEFDYLKEKNIYSFLWGLKISKKGVKGLADNEKMNTHSEWVTYIYKKYNDYSVERLDEFSRFLSQRIRSLKPYVEVSNITVPIMITLIINVVYDLLVDLTKVESAKNILGIIPTFWGLFIALVIILSVIFIAYVMLLSNVTTPLWDNHTEENLLTDYKEVIDNLIKDKVENKKSEKRKKK